MDAATLEHLLLREIRKSPEISRRDLSDRLEIARSTAGRRVDSLIERGMLREKGVEEKDSAGRPRRFIELVGNFGGFVGLDFDARRIFGIVSDFAQNVVARETHDLPANADAETVLSHLHDFHRSLANRVSVDILATGIGVPGRIHSERRLGHEYPFINGWKNIDLLKALNQSPESLFIENNTRAAALGEYAFGAHATTDHLVCLNVRTGISAAVISHGNLLSGKKGMAGEIRNWPARGQVSTLEESASMRTIDDLDTFVADCQAEKPEALAQLNQLAGYHGSAVSQIVQLVDPEVVILSGPLTRLGSLWLDRVRSHAIDQLDLNFFDPPQIDLTDLSNYSGAMGAAALAAEEYRVAG